MNNSKDSLGFTQGEHDNLVERVASSSRCNLIFYRINVSRDKVCFTLVREVLTQNLNVPEEGLEYQAMRGTPSWQAKQLSLSLVSI